MAIRVPEDERAALALLATLPEQEFAALADALESASPSISLFDLGERAARAGEVAPGRAKDLLSVAATLYVIRDAESTPIAEFVDSVCAAMRETDESEEEFSEEETESLRTRLTRILKMDRSLGLTAKALNVFRESDKVFCRSRVITDLRPVFLPGDDDPVASVVTHSLRISYHQGDRLKHFFVTIEASDVEQLQGQLDRAVKKESALRKVAEKAELQCLKFEGQ